MNLFVKTICLVCLCAIVAPPAVAYEVDPFYGRNDQVQQLVQDIESREDKIDELKSQADAFQKKIEEAQKASKSLQNQLGILENLLAKTQIDIRASELNIDKNKLEIDALGYEIRAREKDIAEQKNSLAAYVQLLEREERTTFLELLILYPSFSEFFTQLNAAKELQANIRRSVDRLELSKTALEARTAELQVVQESLEKEKKILEDHLARYQEDQTAKGVLLSQTRSKEDSYQRLLVEARQQQNEIDEDVSQIQEQLKKKIERLRVSGGTPKTTLVSWPVDHGRGISAYFHDPGYPFRHIFEHPAVDIRAYQGTPINAPADGYVSRVADNGYGYSYIILIHDNGISTVYGHVSKILVREDQFVKAGQIIGLTGGRPGTRGAGRLTTGPHLHFEVRLNGIPVNPLDYLP